MTNLAFLATHSRLQRFTVAFFLFACSGCQSQTARPVTQKRSLATTQNIQGPMSKKKPSFRLQVQKRLHDSKRSALELKVQRWAKQGLYLKSPGFKGGGIKQGHQPSKEISSPSLSVLHPSSVKQSTDVATLNEKAWSQSNGRIKLNLKKLRIGKKIRDSWPAGKERPKVFFVEYDDGKTYAFFVRKNLKIFYVLWFGASFQTSMDRTRSIFAIMPRHHHVESSDSLKEPIYFYSLEGKLIAEYRRGPHLTAIKGVSQPKTTTPFDLRDFIYVEHKKNFVFQRKRDIIVAAIVKKRLRFTKVFYPSRKRSYSNFTVVDFALSKSKNPHLIVSAFHQGRDVLVSTPLSDRSIEPVMGATKKCSGSKLIVGVNKVIAFCYSSKKSLMIEVFSKDLKVLWTRTFKYQSLHHYFHFGLRHLPLLFSKNEVYVILLVGNTLRVYESSDGSLVVQKKTPCLGLYPLSSDTVKEDFSCRGYYKECLFFSSKYSLKNCIKTDLYLSSRWIFERKDYRFADKKSAFMVNHDE